MTIRQLTLAKLIVAFSQMARAIENSFVAFPHAHTAEMETYERKAAISH